MTKPTEASLHDTDRTPTPGRPSPSSSGPLQRAGALYCLLGLAVMYTLYFAKSLLVPIVVALLFALLLSPLVRLFKRFHIPRTVSAMILLTAIGGPFTWLGIELAEPAQKWAASLPELSAQMARELNSIEDSVTSQATPAPKKSGFFSFFSSEEAPAPPKDENTLSKRVMQGGMEVMISVLSATPIVIAQFLTFVILVLFLLIFGPNLYATVIDILPKVKDKRRTILLVGKIQQELSRYIITVSLINFGLGLVTTLVLWLMGMEDPLLWGALVGLLNYAPYVGPLISVCILSIAGASQYGPILNAILPAAVYFGINLLEAQFVTPMVLGKHMRLNPLILIIWLILWGWLWGAIGVLLAVPLLVCLKLAADHLNLLTPWLALIQTRA
ncbi:AI-2E family transporter [Aestuariicella hydrocarbonica]|uniref:AI-2E family transporter n=1 Tax=Pseudomaricurvus hydrocarbonicus TaxID=1470433 RepID=A0A9E5JTP0_9GAMM|nr:AI-2E family transporter [Aestuariicella hydrocarbonica]NHO64331.1 AI-2E family transporter [Aestuariicella hydrocarbonica]